MDPTIQIGTRNFAILKREEETEARMFWQSISRVKWKTRLLEEQRVVACGPVRKSIKLWKRSRSGGAGPRDGGLVGSWARGNHGWLGIFLAGVMDVGLELTVRGQQPRSSLNQDWRNAVKVPNFRHEASPFLDHPRITVFGAYG